MSPTIILVILGILAVIYLSVGVSNDAVNFLNSAIGSKAAPKIVIMIVASVGILVGCLTSSGMMDISQNGVFNPSLFTYENVMYLFLATMFGNIILLDLYNTFGMPTSTTVSLIFGLLGSAVGIALVVLWETPADGNVGNYINASGTLKIISGILLSVVIAFVCGGIIMYLTRLIFTFDYKPLFNRCGALWSGLAFTCIIYFTVIKGFQSTDSTAIKGIVDYVNSNFWLSMGAMMIIFTFLSLLLQKVFKVNILKVTILAGTFALALAFAGNDLVNFIGVFIAGVKANFLANGDPTTYMDGMAAGNDYEVPYTTWILVAAGVVMVITLFTSKKTDNVTKTEVNLATQGEREERFDSTQLSRFLVRVSMSFSKNIGYITPKPLRRYIDRRFEAAEASEGGQKAAFDPIRATVNLTVSAIIISFATSFKLPLSTTYVTFMVAMGTSLADRAWGRESAVYRITGVMTVITGWFLTAFLAFAIAFVIALFLAYAGTAAIWIMAGLCGLLLIQSSISTRRKQAKEEKQQTNVVEIVKQEPSDIMIQCADDITTTLNEVKTIYSQTLKGLFKEERKLLKQMVKESNALYQKASDKKYAVYTMLHTLNENYVRSGHYYVQVVDYVNEVTKALAHITNPSFEHINNNHQGFVKEQIRDLRKVEKKVNGIFDMTEHIVRTNDWDNIETAMAMRDELFNDFATIISHQIQRIKEGETSTRSSMLFLDIISETKAMVLHTRNMLKSQKFFVTNE